LWIEYRAVLIQAAFFILKIILDIHIPSWLYSHARRIGYDNFSFEVQAVRS
jgi:hypothetical protein